MLKEKDNILYVDDEVNNLEAFKAAFRRDYNVYTAASGREALNILRSISPIKVIITDQRMPEMSGVQFLEAILPEFPNSVRMILTGFSDIEAIIKAINTGKVSRYITKPWNFDELGMVINNGIKLYDLEHKNTALMMDLQKENEKSQQIMNVFKKYVPENIIKEVLYTGDETSIIGGESRIVSVMVTISMILPRSLKK